MTRMTKEAMTAKERIGHYKARIHNEIHDPMSDDDNKGMATVTRSMCRELDNIVRAVEERCAETVYPVMTATPIPKKLHKKCCDRALMIAAAIIRKGGR